MVSLFDTIPPHDQDVQEQGNSRTFPVRETPSGIIERARRKLMAIDAASKLTDRRVPPSNRLEALKGERFGQHSIRINDQWRICFVWKDAEVFDEVCDYH